MTRERETDDGTYPFIEEELQKYAERAVDPYSREYRPSIAREVRAIERNQGVAIMARQVPCEKCQRTESQGHCWWCPVGKEKAEKAAIDRLPQAGESLADCAARNAAADAPPPGETSSEDSEPDENGEVSLGGTQTSVNIPEAAETAPAPKSEDLTKEGRQELLLRIESLQNYINLANAKKAATPPHVNFAFVLIDLTTDATPAAMRPASSFPEMIDALFEQFEGPYAAHYGAGAVSFRIGTEHDRKPNEIAIHFRDTIPEAPDALAYHQVVNGVPDIEIGVDLFTALLRGQESVICGVSHELLELGGDIGANGWKDRQDASGQMDAEELCDFVQNTSYAASNGCTMSNFLLPSFFIPGSLGPWDHLGVMSSHYDVSHGYCIIATEPSKVTQVMGKLAEHPTIHGHLTDVQRKRRSHPYSRTYRRGVHLAPVAAE